MVLPFLCLLNKSHVALLAYGSIPDVGSSRMTNLELATNATPTLQVYDMIDHCGQYDRYDQCDQYNHRDHHDQYDYQYGHHDMIIILDHTLASSSVLLTMQQTFD